MSKTLTKFGETFVSYGSYHNNSVNQWIHVVCVPIIAATLICALSYIPFSYQFQGYTIGADTLGIAIAMSYYLSINIAFGFGMIVLTLLMTAGWRLAFQNVPQQHFLWWVLGIHIVAWIFQFIGHGVFEKRKPALLDNLSQVLNAPLFVLVEILMKMGYKSEETTYWQELIDKRVAQFRQKNQTKSN